MLWKMLPGQVNFKGSPSMTNAKPLRRLDIALSFPGEHRTFVEQAATHLTSKFGKERILSMSNLTLPQPQQRSQ
jgi:hypothetical protein